MKKICLLFIASCLTLACFAELKDSTQITHKHEFGIHLGMVTGAGLSYRYWPGRFGVQFSALPLKKDKNINVDAGLTALFSVYDSKNLRFFCYWGNNLIFQRDVYYFEKMESSTKFIQGNHLYSIDGPKTVISYHKTYNNVSSTNLKN